MLWCGVVCVYSLVLVSSFVLCLCLLICLSFLLLPSLPPAPNLIDHLLATLHFISTEIFVLLRSSAACLLYALSDHYDAHDFVLFVKVSGMVDWLRGDTWGRWSGIAKWLVTPSLSSTPPPPSSLYTNNNM